MSIVREYSARVDRQFALRSLCRQGLTPANLYRDILKAGFLP
jgi:hypothetical protein